MGFCLSVILPMTVLGRPGADKLRKMAAARPEAQGPREAFAPKMSYFSADNAVSLPPGLSMLREALEAPENRHASDRAFIVIAASTFSNLASNVLYTYLRHSLTACLVSHPLIQAN